MDDTTLGRVVLGIAGFRLLSAELAGGEVCLHVETAATRVGCVDCGVVAVPHARRVTRVRDLPVAGRPCQLLWHKRVWRCEEPACGRRTWTERREDVLRPRFSLTERARAEICRRVGRGESVAAVAVAFGCAWHTAMNAVRDHGTPLVGDAARTAGVVALGVDETSFLSGGPRRRARFVTGLVDLGRGRLLDIVDGRAGSVVSAWLEARDEGWLSAGRTRRARSLPRLLQRPRGWPCRA